MYFRSVFAWIKLFVYTDSFAKIDTQLHTEVKVEHTEAKVKEIFKVFR